jgi:hypothetical protein
VVAEFGRFVVCSFGFELDRLCYAILFSFEERPVSQANTEVNCDWLFLYLYTW